MLNYNVIVILFWACVDHLCTNKTTPFTYYLSRVIQLADFTILISLVKLEAISA